MKHNAKVLFVKPYDSTFIQKDIELLSKNYAVSVIDYNLFKSTWRTKIRLIVGVLSSDITFSWFSDRHAYWTVKLARCLRKKSIVIIGGYEVARMPSISYGLLINPRSAKRVEYTLKNADRVLAVDECLIKEAVENLKISVDNFEVVPTGYDPGFFRSLGDKKDIVVTVGTGTTWAAIKKKGIDVFVAAAKLLPEMTFLVIGIEGNVQAELKEKAAKNVQFFNQLPQCDVVKWFQVSKVYCSLSLHEGLPNAVCESMLCECVPVGTNNPGVMTAIGDTGFYVSSGDVNVVAKAIKNALSEGNGKKARERIINNFTLEKREKRLVNIINEVLRS